MPLDQNNQPLATGDIVVSGSLPHLMRICVVLGHPDRLGATFVDDVADWIRRGRPHERLVWGNRFAFRRATADEIAASPAPISPLTERDLEELAHDGALPRRRRKL